jgi:hypothetical protein
MGSIPYLYFFQVTSTTIILTIEETTVYSTVDNFAKVGGRETGTRTGFTVASDMFTRPENIIQQLLT